MRKFVAERDLPGAGELSLAQLRSVARQSSEILKKLGPQIQWVESFVTQNRIYSIFIAEDERLIRDHAEQGGYPLSRIAEVFETIDPTHAEK